MEIKEKREGKRSIIAIDGRLDTLNYGAFEEKFNELSDTEVTEVIVNCSKMDYVSSSGLRIFLMFLKAMKAKQGRFILCALQPNIREIFEIAGFISIFEIQSDEAAALKKLDA